jgi:hypothetical protein
MSFLSAVLSVTMTANVWQLYDVAEIELLQLRIVQKLIDELPMSFALQPPYHKTACWW